MKTDARPDTIVIALGGNAFQTKGDKGTAEEYWRNAYTAADLIVRLVEEKYGVVVTHGNGPQVGIIAEWMSLGLKNKNIPPMPLDVAGAMSQGWLGYMLQQALYNKLAEKKLLGSLVKGVVTVITQTLVDRNDPAFKDPTKYIGPWYEKDEAEKLSKELGWVFKPDPRGGYRRVVASPDPIGQVEIDAIKTLVEQGFIVIADGGGGIPVYRGDDGLLHGVEAVIDKDLGAERMASALEADVLLILTDVEKAYLNYGTPNAKPLDVLRVSEALKYYREGHFKPGSMGPKILAGVRFVQNGGKMAVIAHLKQAYDALKGNAGTRIIPD
ncbi:carbamate kinase [Desulfurococcus mucosus DSM 2162]|uniref:Carbamate kinase n=2 Tax=Desulfurococcus mucosus TaxID=2275 RepID=E8R7I3_DESM0|nr:carbamate kinase [Desulfurococcus mucosus DSM 2162]